jgi:hypothetical protein
MVQFDTLHCLFHRYQANHPYPERQLIMTWQETVRRYPNQWIIFEVQPLTLSASQAKTLRILESGCAPHTILKRCNELAHGETLRTVRFAHTTWETPDQDVALRTLPTGFGIAV